MNTKILAFAALPLLLLSCDGEKDSTVPSSSQTHDLELVEVTMPETDLYIAPVSSILPSF